MRFSLRVTYCRIIILTILALMGWRQSRAQASGNLIINELMVNPNNVAALPSFEYIELYNNSGSTVNLASITLQINNNQTSLPTYFLAPQQYVILCSADAVDDFSRYGNAIAPSRWYALANTGATVRLLQQNTVIDQVSYRDSWYNSPSKRNGGWSLERINPDWLCDINLNWSATLSLTGGTPGKANTIFNKRHKPDLQLINYEMDNNRLTLEFNIDASYWTDVTTPIFEIQDFDTARSFEVTDNKVVLIFSKMLEERTLYSLRVRSLTLCNIPLEEQLFSLFYQPTVSTKDILISEILFNPKEGGVDFVEIYNNSNLPINIQGFTLGNRVVTHDFYLLQPQQYLALTTNKRVLLQQYPNAFADNILEVAALPPYPNQQGIVTLFDNKNQLIDSIYYNANMHGELMQNVKGISLERRSFQDIKFYSASTLAGGATPGYQNSTATLNIPQNRIYLASKTMSPDGDGFEDELQLLYELVEPNYLITAEIYNDKGILVKRLAHLHHAGTHGQLQWDGKDKYGNHCKQGHYICSVQIFNTDGKAQQFKQPFVLINSLTRH